MPLALGNQYHKEWWIDRLEEIALAGQGMLEPVEIVMFDELQIPETNLIV